MRLDEYRSLKNKVLSRVGFTESLTEEGLLPSTRVEERRTSELTWESRRLADLRQQYAAYPCAAQRHSMWNASLIHGINLSTFRADSAYMWQHRDGNVPVHYMATYYHHRISCDADLLDRCTEDGSFGVYSLSVDGTLVTRDRVDSVAELGFLREAFSLGEHSRLRVLDIGSGYGRLAWRMNQCFPDVSMLCVDAVPESAFVCEYYLSHRAVSPNVEVVPLPSLETELSRETVDLAIAVNSLTECTVEAINWWLDLLEAHSVRHILLVPHGGCDGGRQMFSTELPGAERTPMVTLLEQHGYKKISMRPKYREAAMQSYGISPTYFHLFSLSGRMV